MNLKLHLSLKLITGVGKSSLVTRYETRTFTPHTSSTIGAAYSHVRMSAHGCRVNMQVTGTENLMEVLLRGDAVCGATLKSLDLHKRGQHGGGGPLRKR